MDGDGLSERAGTDAAKWSQRWGRGCAVGREGEGRGRGGGELSTGFERRWGACAVEVGILLGEERELVGVSTSDRVWEWHGEPYLSIYVRIDVLAQS